jgi:hypothetical protein
MGHPSTNGADRCQMTSGREKELAQNQKAMFKER